MISTFVHTTVFTQPLEFPCYRKYLKITNATLTGYLFIISSLSKLIIIMLRKLYLFYLEKISELINADKVCERGKSTQLRPKPGKQKQDIKRNDLEPCLQVWLAYLYSRFMLCLPSEELIWSIACGMSKLQNQSGFGDGLLPTMHFQHYVDK